MRCWLHGGTYRGPHVVANTCATGLHGFVSIGDVSYYVRGNVLVSASLRIGTIAEGDTLDIQILPQQCEGPLRLPRVTKLLRA